MTCGPVAEQPKKTGNVLVGVGGMACTAPLQANVEVHVRIRHHRRFRTDRTLGELKTAASDGVQLQVEVDCSNRSNRITVFTEAIAAGQKRQSQRSSIVCG